MPRLRWIVAWALLSLAPGPLLASAIDERVAWLRSNAVAMATLDPASPDLADLEPLRRILAGVRVVMLGEATRGDGSSFLARTRLVRYLHQEMGFDVLVFEGGFYDCARAWEAIRGGGGARAALSPVLFPAYTEAAQFQPLIDLIAARAATERTLLVAGMDDQSGAGTALLADLRAALPRFGIEPASVKGLTEMETAFGDVLLERHLTGQAAVPSRPVRQQVLGVVGELRRRLVSTDSDAAFWSQVLANLESYSEASWRQGRWSPGEPFSPEINNLRDRQMARNLVWLADQRHRDRKLIVWSLNVHLARDLDRLNTREAATRAKFDRMSTVGDEVRRALGNDVYTIATTAFAGDVGTPSDEPSPLLVPTPGSFEDLMARTGLEAALVDLRTLGPGARWLERGLIARPISYKELLGIWPRHVDALLFLRHSSAAVRAQPGVILRPGRRR